MQIQQNVNEISLDSSGCYVPVRAARGDEGRERSLLAQCSQSPLLPQALCFHHPVCSPSEGGVYYIDMILFYPIIVRAFEHSTHRGIVSLPNDLADSFATRWAFISGVEGQTLYPGSLCV